MSKGPKGLTVGAGPPGLGTAHELAWAGIDAA